MIDKVLKYIVEAIDRDLSGPDITQEPQVVLGNLAFADAYQDSSADIISDKLVASVVNISQENTLRNLPYRKSQLNEEGIPLVQERTPEIWLNVFILFGANQNKYDSALNYISRIIGFFQRKHVYTPDDLQNMVGETITVDLPNVYKLIFELYSMSFEELNQMWGILGGKYIPSVLYKMRMAVIQEAEMSTSPHIDSIGASPNGI